MKTRKCRSAARVLAFIMSIMLIFGLLPAVAFADSPPPVSILITSDVHDRTEDLEDWLTALHEGTSTLNHMIFGGDFTYRTDANAAEVAASCASMAKSIFNDVPVVKARGNHDLTGTYDSGLVYDGDDYAIYALDLDTTTINQIISMDKIEALDTALSQIDPSKPIIVVSHYPLHYYESRTTANAPELVQRLNKYPNAIVLWGHNHTLSDPGYGTVKKDGDTIQCAAGLAPAAIHFTYVNMGSIYAAVNNAAGVLLTMTKNGTDTVLNFQYKNLSGSTGSEYNVTVDTTFIAEKPTINTPPQDVSVGVGEDASLSVDATVSDGGSLSYQWYQDDNSDSIGGTPIGENSPVFSAPTQTPGIKNYYCQITNLKDGDTASVTSAAARVRVTSGDAGSVTYEYALSIESGARYVIVDKSETDAYALTTSPVTIGDTDFLMCSPVAVSGGTLDPGDVDDSMVWELTTDGNGYNVKNGGSILHRLTGTTGSVYLDTEDEGAAYTDWKYNSTTHNLNVTSTGQGDLFLYQTSSGDTNFFTYGTNASNSIYLYKLIVSNPIAIDRIDITGVDEPAAGAAPDTSASTASTGVITPAVVTWNPAANPFGYDTAYTASITLSAQFAYEFTSETAVTVNGAPTDTVSLNSNGTLTVTYAFDKTAAAPRYTYEYATGIESGCTYVIVDVGTTNYALTASVVNSNYLAATAVTVNDSIINSQDISSNMLWTFTTDGNGYNVKNGSNFLTRPSGGGDIISLKTTDDGSANTDWQYDSTNHVIKIKGSSSTYYLYQTGSNPYYFAVASNDTNAKTMYLYKQTAVPPTEISSATVTGIDVPVAGSPPDTTATVETGNVTASAVTWTPSVSSFGYHTVYTASVKLYPQPGYAFTAETTVTINGHTVQPVLNTNGSLTASYTFDATEPELITKVEVTDITAPAAGNTPDKTALVSPQGVTASEVTWEPDVTAFGYHTAYTASVTLTAQTGFEFDLNATVTINGETADVEPGAGGTLIASYTFDATEPEPITGVAVTGIDAPTAKGTPDTTASVTADSVTASAVTWEPADNPFGFGTVYKASVTLTAKAGYVFTDGVTVTINGHTALISNRTSGTLTASYSFDATEAAVDAEAPQITGQPQSITVSEGGSADLTVTANVSQGTLSYQWYKNTEDNNTNGTLISGASSAAYSAPTDTIGTLYYYCAVTNTDNTATGKQTAETTTQTCNVTVQTQQFVITALPSNSSYGTATGGGRYDKGATVTLTATPKPKYCFVCWKKSGMEVSRSSVYTFTALSSASYTAQFAAATPVGIGCSKIDVSIYGASNGSVGITASGGDSGSYEYSLNGGTSWQSSAQFGGLAAGTYTAAARDAQNPANTATCSVAVGQPKHMGNIAAKKLPSRANAGTALTIVPPAAPKGYTVVSVTYSSSNPSVASVDSGGTVTFLAGGKATIITKIVYQTTDKKGKVKTKTTTIKKTITVKQPVASISLNVSTATIARTQKLKLTASAAPVTASNKKIAWKSSNSKVASVSSAGVVTGKAGGTAVITCTAKDGSGVTASCTVTVTPIYPTGVKMSKQTLTLKTGKTASLRATVLPKNTDFKTVTWSSGNSAIVTVDAKGRVKGVSPGTAVVTATTSNGHTVSCTVTVK